MHTFIRICSIVIVLLFFNTATLARNGYGAQLCKDSNDFSCHVVQRGETWAVLFPDSRERDIEMRINRMGIEPEPGMRIAIANSLSSANAMDYSPLPREISPMGEKVIVVSIGRLAWGAYDGQGSLVKWGPVSTAQGYCPDIHKGCHTSKGRFSVYRKEGARCVSSKFPVGRGGAPMPYCMYFNGGFALHGSYEVPGYNASHGCVRMLVGDAQWMNEEFLPAELHTPVIITQ